MRNKQEIKGNLDTFGSSRSRDKYFIREIKHFVNLPILKYYSYFVIHTGFFILERSNSYYKEKPIYPS